MTQIDQSVYLKLNYYICLVNVKHDRQKVLKIGQSLFSSKGYTNTGTNEICNVTGMAKGAFYNAFTSKENFMLSCLESYGKMNVSYIHEELADKGIKPIDRLLNLYSGMITNQSSTNYAGCLINNTMSELSSSNEIIRERTEVLFKRLVKEIEPLIIESQESGVLDPMIDSYSLAELIHSSFFGILNRAKSSKDIKRGIATITLLIHSLKP